MLSLTLPFALQPIVNLIQPHCPFVYRVYLPQEGGRPTGVAFVAFATTDDATAARGKHRQMLGTRYVEIFPVDRR